MHQILHSALHHLLQVLKVVGMQTLVSFATKAILLLQENKKTQLIL